MDCPIITTGMVHDVFTTGQAADICRVNSQTVVKWIRKGLLKAYCLPGMGDRRIAHRRITHASLAAFLAKHEMPADRLPKLVEAVA